MTRKFFKTAATLTQVVREYHKTWGKVDELEAEFTKLKADYEERIAAVSAERDAWKRRRDNISGYANELGEQNNLLKALLLPYLQDEVANP